MRNAHALASSAPSGDRRRALAAFIPTDRTGRLRWLARGVALIGLPGALWTLYELLRYTPWAGQPALSLVGQGLWSLALVVDLAGMALAFRSGRGAGWLLLAVGLAMLIGVVGGRIWDIEHWATIFLPALGALALPAIVAGGLLFLANSPGRSGPH